MNVLKRTDNKTDRKLGLLNLFIFGGVGMIGVIIYNAMKITGFDFLMDSSMQPLNCVVKLLGVNMTYILGTICSFGLGIYGYIIYTYELVEK